MSNHLQRLLRLERQLEQQEEAKYKQGKVFIIKPHNITREDLKVDTTDLKGSIKSNLASWFKKAQLQFKPLNDYMQSVKGKKHGKVVVIVDDLGKDDRLSKELDSLFNLIAQYGLKKNLIDFMKLHYKNATDYLKTRIKLPAPSEDNPKQKVKVLDEEAKKARKAEIERQLAELEAIQNKRKEGR